MPNRNNPAFGEWLKSQLRIRGLNQTEFANRVGVSHSTVSRWVRGRVPEAYLLDSISDVLVVDYDEVATRSGIRPKVLELDPASPEGRLVPLIRRVDWDSRPGRLEEMEAEFRFMIQVDQGRVFKD